MGGGRGAHLTRGARQAAMAHATPAMAATPPGADSATKPPVQALPCSAAASCCGAVRALGTGARGPAHPGATKASVSLTPLVSGSGTLLMPLHFSNAGRHLLLVHARHFGLLCPPRMHGALHLEAVQLIMVPKHI